MAGKIEAKAGQWILQSNKMSCRYIYFQYAIKMDERAGNIIQDIVRFSSRENDDSINGNAIIKII